MPKLNNPRFLINLINNLEDNLWKSWLILESQKSYFLNLEKFVSNEYLNNLCYPKYVDIFKVFNLIKPEEIKVIILGQDPYSTNDMADGIAFSVKNKKISKSLKNIINVIEKNGYECQKIHDGNLEYLLKQGVLLINTCLTVQANKPLSHINIGWEILITNIIQNLINLKNPLCFMLWGNKAKNFLNFFTLNNQNLILTTSHPSPLSYHNGFKDSLDFNKCNKFLKEYNIKNIDWGGKCFQQEK